MTLKAPFPYFGGKRSVADLIWDRFGNVPNYIEPFAGSLAVLLCRPWEPGTETVNDIDCMIANFWRALQADPDAVAYHADWPVNEADQHARHLWLCSREEFREQMKVDPEYYDAQIAGRWVWGQCIWIGSGWCSVELPHLGDAGKGLNRKLPHLGDAGTGECLVSDPISGTPTSQAILAYMRELAARLRRVRVCCGDWSRICGPSPTVKHGITGVFLDPPYTDEAERTDDLYSSDDGDVAHSVRVWAIEWGADPRMRIALCSYGEDPCPDGWRRIHWKARGGYGSQAKDGNQNAERECIDFSPHCLSASLFEMVNEFVSHDQTEVPHVI